jgi:hypothetical protein
MRRAGGKLKMESEAIWFRNRLTQKPAHLGLAGGDWIEPDQHEGGCVSFE